MGPAFWLKPIWSRASTSYPASTAAVASTLLDGDDAGAPDAREEHVLGARSFGRRGSQNARRIEDRVPRLRKVGVDFGGEKEGQSPSRQL